MQPADIRAAFDAMDWESPAPNVRFKAIRRGGVQLRVVEFTRGFVEHDWCEKRHIGYVLSGEIAIETPDGVILVREGQGIVLPGPHARHKACPVSDRVTLFLMEDG
jgi:quercetin dioxygenase-like cupin family protein